VCASQAPIELAAFIARLEEQYEAARASLPPALADQYTCALARSLACGSAGGAWLCVTASKHL
jgi:hypothetical protein